MNGTDCYGVREFLTWVSQQACAQMNEQFGGARQLEGKVRKGLETQEVRQHSPVRGLDVVGPCCR